MFHIFSSVAFPSPVAWLTAYSNSSRLPSGSTYLYFVKQNVLMPFRSIQRPVSSIFVPGAGVSGRYPLAPPLSVEIARHARPCTASRGYLTERTVAVMVCISVEIISSVLL